MSDFSLTGARSTPTAEASGSDPGPAVQFERAASASRRAQADDVRSAGDPRALARGASRAEGGRGQPLPHGQAIQQSFGEHDVSGIRAFVGGAHGEAARGMGAEAYASGDEVAFQEAPDLHTAAHEAAHVVQQQAGVQLLGGVGQAGDRYEQNADAVADRVVAGRSAADLLPPTSGGSAPAAVQMRRLPTNTGALLGDPADPANPGANAAAHAGGTRRLIEIAEAELSAPERAQVDTATLGGQSQAEFDALPEHQRLTRRVEAIRSVRPDLSLGDPNLIDTGPRPGTFDGAKLLVLIVRAMAIYVPIVAGSRDTDLEQVFGATRVADATAKYKNGLEWMARLYAAGRVVTDRSGYNAEVGLGGLTGFQDQISVMPDAIDNPNDHESIITMIHESMHAGNSDVDDQGYIGTQVFTQLSEDVKLTNAAHFEVVPRRMLGADHAYPGETFTPAGSTGPGGATSAPLTAMQTAVRAASEHLRTVWTIGLNLHSLYVDAYGDPGQWTTAQRGGSYREGLPYWSKVQKLTIHEKTAIDPASPDPARRPVSQIDVALSEGMTRKYVQCMSLIGAVPDDDAGAQQVLDANATAAEVTAAAGSPEQARDLWLRVVRRRIGSLTGSEDRDLRAFQALVDLDNVWGTVLQQRDPNGFPN